jgi:transposase-like protein
VLGIREGASENAATATSLLEDLVERGLDSQRRYLFVIDGSKALRCAIDKVFGKGNPVQRCRRHKIGNVCGRLPDDLAEQVKAVMKAAYRLPWREGVARLKKQAEWLEAHHPDAAASLREGLEETFTINRLELSSSLRLCLATTNVIESPHSGVRMRTGRVSRWKDGNMVLRWTAAAFLETEKSFRRIQGYRDLWMLKAKLQDDVSLDTKEKVA